MLDLAILGFLAEGSLPGHELRRRVSQLTGYTRPVSDGSLYPAINRLAKADLLERCADPGAGAARYVLSLTDAGRTELLKRLRKPADHEITDFTRFFTVLAFLSHLPDVSEQHAVLRRRLEFLEEPASFFYSGDRPLRAEEVPDPYRRGMLLTARAISSAERAWLHSVLDGGEPTENASFPLDEPAS
jgi:DNA-binding PadR family transcriptional regulator